MYDEKLLEAMYFIRMFGWKDSQPVAHRRANILAKYAYFKLQHRIELIAVNSGYSSEMEPR